MRVFIEHGVTFPPTQYRLQARTTLNNSSLLDIITVVSFALSPSVYLCDNETVQKLNGVTSSGLCVLYEIMLSQYPKKGSVQMICAVLCV